MKPEDLAWVATDLLTLAIDEEFPDPEYLAISFREAVPAGREQMLFEGMARGDAPGHRGCAQPPGRIPPGQAGREGGDGPPRTKPPRAAVSPLTLSAGHGAETRPGRATAAATGKVRR